MLTRSEPCALLGPYSGIFLKPVRPQHRINLKNAQKGILTLQGFEPVEVNLLENYNKDITVNRTWWFRFNQLPTLGWAAGFWTEGNDVTDLIHFNFKVISNWVSHTAENLPLKWHDHASAFRMKNMADWYITVARHSTEYDKDLELLAQLIDEHLQWLCDDRNYSRHTNHGFEQARFMMSVASELPGLPSSGSALQLALMRLQDEIHFAFTGQGVHKENSPGYQWFMIKVMQEAKEMLDGYNLSLPDIDFRKMLNRAKRFLDTIALPDNSLPLIGDTQYKEKQNNYVAKLRRSKPTGEGLQIFDYSKSGYVIIKDFTDKNAPIHLVFKNAHLSDYHRHNDDLAIHLAKGNNIIFGDGGLYSHNQDDVGRQYAKSAWAHSTVFPIDNAEKKVKRKKIYKAPSIEFVESKSICGRTWFYHPDVIIKREISLVDKLGLSNFTVIDTVTEGERSAEIVSCFIIPIKGEEIEINQTKGTASFSVGDVQCCIGFDREHVSAIVKNNLSEADTPDKCVFVSQKMGTISQASRIEFLWQSGLKQKSSKFYVTIE